MIELQAFALNVKQNIAKTREGVMKSNTPNKAEMLKHIDTIEQSIGSANMDQLLQTIEKLNALNDQNS